MKTHLPAACAVLVAVSACYAEEAKKPKDSAPGKPVKITPLTKEQQGKLLGKRGPGSMLGRFNSFASLLYAVDNIIVHTNEEEIGATVLHSPFPDFYKPTRAEFFNAIARQTSSSWSYDEKTSCWVFAKPALTMPFKVTLPPGWYREERGNYLFCKPESAPVGMDIYVMGEFSSSPEDPKLAARIREATAMMFAQNIKEGVTPKDMSLVKLGQCEALHFKSPAPKPDITWRQWVIAEGGKTIVIVSAIDDANEKIVLPGVEEAIKSFELK